MISYILALVTGLAILGLDQYTKYIVAAAGSAGTDGRVLIPKLIDLIYIRNNGGAWGMLGGSTVVLLLITVVIMAVCIALLIKYGRGNKFFFWSIVLVLSGGLGNMIDRIVRGGYVVDFMHFTFWQNFPVFNVADCAIVIGAGMLILCFLLDTVNEAGEKSRNKGNSEDENG